MSSHAHSERPLGGKILTPAFVILVLIALAGVAMTIYRLFYGLGSVSAMNDSYPWGIWKPFNVVTLTGMAAGAYAVGILAYIFNRGQYHPLVRSAILTGALGYTLAGTSVLVDLGRWWNLWVIFWPPVYNLNSVLLEVAICVMAYCMVLWIEVSPAVMEHWSQYGKGFLQRISSKLLPVMKKLLPFIISMAILLPTMHQSSLGGLYMVTPTKLHGLWHSPWISGLFLLSCLTMGFGSVVIVENLTTLVWKRRMDQSLLGRMSPVPAVLSIVYVALRIGDLAYHGKLSLLGQMDMYTGFFIAEMVLFLLPAAMMLMKGVRKSRKGLFVAALLLVLAGALYRFDTYLVAYLPQSGHSYFPNAGEFLFTAALVSAGIAVYVVMVKVFPILSGVLERKVARAKAAHDAAARPTAD